jgi:hypothetical protein
LPVKGGLKILNPPLGCQAGGHPVAFVLQPVLSSEFSGGGDDMGYIVAWLLGVPVTLLLLFWLFFGRG